MSVNRKYKTWQYLFVISLFLISIGLYKFQDELVPIQMTYGNFDIPNKISFVNKLAPGTFDYASIKNYLFISINYHPLIILVLIIFPFTLIWGLYKNWEYWKARSNRIFIQWFSFILARIGVIRVSGIYPIKRTCFGTFPFLNCQACEMASGACPIGLLQNLIFWGVFPFYLLGTILLFVIFLGKSICGWLCPFGFISDLFDKISIHKTKIPRELSYLRYVILCFVIIGPIIYKYFNIIDKNFFCATFCGSGKILGLLPYYLTTASVDFYNFKSWFLNINFITINFQAGMIVLLVIVMLLISGRIFCRILCPLGGFLGLFYPVSFLQLKHTNTKCNKCGACENVCPMGVSSDYVGFTDKSQCILCGRCILICKCNARKFIYGFGENECYYGRNFNDYKEWLMTTTSYSEHLLTKIMRKYYLYLLSFLSNKPLQMAQYAYNNTSFYKKIYKSFPEDFSSLPLVYKKDLGSCSPYDILSNEHKDDVIYYGETTGSTGFPTPVFYTSKEFAAAKIFTRITPYFEQLKETIDNNRAVINGLSFGYTIAGMSFADLLLSLGACVANAGSRSTIATPPRTARAIARLKPSIITAAPLDLLCWLKILKEDFPQEYNDVLSELKVVLSTAELCATSRSKAIQNEFGFLHIDVYACVEGFFSLPCPCGELHILPNYYTEVFDENLNLLGNFGEGRFAFTNLIKKSSPLVRYLLDDFVTIYQSKCKYGFNRSIIPYGRWELTVKLNNKNLGVRHFEEAIFRHGLFGDYRVILEENLITFVLEEYGSHNSLQQIEQSLSDEFKQKVKVEIVPFGTITKYREVRFSKPILKVEDKRSCSTQKIPEFL